MPNRLHSARVARLVARGASTRGFRSETLKFLKGCRGWTVDYEKDIKVPRYVPDAYRLDAATGKITVWEVEVSHPVSDAKVGAYMAFWADLDASDIRADFELRIVDRHGFERSHNLAVHYYAALSDCDPSDVAGALAQRLAVE